MPERAIFLDRDNTIIDNDGYLGDPAKVRLLPGAATALVALRSLGYRLIVVSNQSGVARGMFDEAAVEAVNAEMDRQLKLQGAYVDVSYYCPYHPDAVVPAYRADHEWRKPKPGMLNQAAVDFNLDLSQCWMIGDMDRDIAAGAAVGCRTILLKNPEHLAPPEPNGTKTSPNFIVKSLADAARIIVREGPVHPHPPSPPPPPAPSATPAPQAAPAPHTVPDPQRPPPPAAGPIDTPPHPAPAPNPAASSPSPIQNPLQSPAPEQPPIPTPFAAPTPLVPTSPAPAEPPPSPTPAQRAESHALQSRFDELLSHFRRQSRHSELRPELSKLELVAMIVQIFTLLALACGTYVFLSTRMTLNSPNDIALAGLSYQRTIIWLLTAIILQGIVIALLIQSHHRQ